MSNINLKTIGSLPLVEEANENTSLVGWDGEKTVRVAKDMVGGGSGGVTSWNDLEDKPFGDLEESYNYNGEITMVNGVGNFVMQKTCSNNKTYRISLRQGLNSVAYGSFTYEYNSTYGVDQFNANPDENSRFTSIIGDGGGNYTVTIENNSINGECEFMIIENNQDLVKELPYRFIPNKARPVVITRDAQGNFSCTCTYADLRSGFYYQGAEDLSFTRNTIVYNNEYETTWRSTCTTLCNFGNFDFTIVVKNIATDEIVKINFHRSNGLSLVTE